MLETTARLEMVWEALRRLCEEAGDIGVYPATDDRLLRLEEGDVKEALQIRAAYQNGALGAPQDMHLAYVLENMGEVAGERFGLDATRATHFGQWLAQAVTGWRSGLGDDDKIEALNEPAARTVHGRQTAVGFARMHADWWMRYQQAIPPMIARLQEASA
jgi:hypothetical protein